MIRIRLKIADAAASKLYGTAIVTCATRAGHRFQLQATFRDLAHAQRTAQQVTAKGSIDRSLWVVLPPVKDSVADVALRAEAASDQLARQRSRDRYRIAA